jgi:hypothetical protein
MSETREVKGRQIALALDSPLVGLFRNTKNFMSFPFFPMEKEIVTSLPVYDDGRVRIEVEGNRYGIANYWDKHLLIYLTSLIKEKMAKGEPVSSTVRFTASDVYAAMHQSYGGSAGQRLKRGLRRLKGTTIYTNIRVTVGDEVISADKGVSWINDYDHNVVIDSTGAEKSRCVEVELSRWFFNLICSTPNVFTYSPGFFTLTPLEKRLYEVARAHCPDGGQWAINLDRLRCRVGSESDLKKFKLNIACIAEAGSIPDYSLRVIDMRQIGRPEINDTDPPVPNRAPLKHLAVVFWHRESKAMSLSSVGSDDDELEGMPPVVPQVPEKPLPLGRTGRNLDATNRDEPTARYISPRRSKKTVWSRDTAGESPRQAEVPFSAPPTIDNLPESETLNGIDLKPRAHARTRVCLTDT